MDLSQLWSVSIGLAKLQGDPSQIGQRFLFALDLLRHFDCTLENKMMAAEILDYPEQVLTTFNKF